MNINEHAEELKKDEQQVLDILITKMDKVIKNLDQRMQSYVEEAGIQIYPLIQILI